MKGTRLRRNRLCFISLVIISTAVAFFYIHVNFLYSSSIAYKANYIETNGENKDIVYISKTNGAVQIATDNDEIKNINQCVRKDIGIIEPKIVNQTAVWKIKNKDWDVERIYSVANYSYLDRSCHASKLISRFKCGNETVKVLILVTSRITSITRRRTIRMTWGKTLHTQVNNDFKTFFMVGKSPDEEVMKKVKQESYFYKDIIFGNFYDIFYNLPYKVEIGFEWAYKHCSFDYYVKADDDVFINLENLFELLSRKDTPKEKLYLGYKQGNPYTIREGKYKVTYEEYRTIHLPPFCSGGGFIFSSDAVKNIIPYFQKDPFKLDDVYIAMLVMNAGMEPRNNNKFRFFEGTCVFNETYITHHGWGTTGERSCMEEIFYTMVAANANHNFIKTHYGLQF